VNVTPKAASVHSHRSWRAELLLEDVITLTRAQVFKHGAAAPHKRARVLTIIRASNLMEFLHVVDRPIEKKVLILRQFLLVLKVQNSVACTFRSKCFTNLLWGREI
jgi:hypothetical protein